MQNYIMEIVSGSIKQFAISINPRLQTSGASTILAHTHTHTQISQIRWRGPNEMTTIGGENHPRWCRKQLGPHVLHITLRNAAINMHYVSSMRDPNS